MEELASRANATWGRFKELAKERWWLWLLLMVLTQWIGNKVADLADVLVGVVNATGLVESFIRGAVGPLGILALVIGALVILAYYDIRHDPNEGRWYDDEWATYDVVKYWDESQGLVRTVRDQVSALLDQEIPATAKLIDEIRGRVESLDFRLASFSDTFSIGSYWGDRNRWGPQSRPASTPAWARQLLDRVDYASWWIHGHTPSMPYLSDGSGDGGSWDGYNGASWDGTLGTSWDGSGGDFGSWAGITGE